MSVKNLINDKTPNSGPISFPLYEELVEEIKSGKTNYSVDGNSGNLQTLCDTIGNLDELSDESAVKHRTQMALLILHHGILNGQNPQDNFVYNPTIMNGGSGLLFRAEKLPKSLLEILYCYINRFARVSKN